MDDKEYIIEIYDEISRFEFYNDIIKLLPEYKIYQREIKLNTLLENKKIQFDIDDIKSINISFFGKILKDSMLDVSSTSVNHPYDPDFKIKSMHFILKDDNVLSLKCTIDTISEELKKINESGLDLHLRILTIGATTSKDHKFVSFYLSKD